MLSWEGNIRANYYVHVGEKGRWGEISDKIWQSHPALGWLYTSPVELSILLGCDLASGMGMAISWVSLRQEHSKSVWSLLYSPLLVPAVIQAHVNMEPVSLGTWVTVIHWVPLLTNWTQAENIFEALIMNIGLRRFEMCVIWPKTEVEGIGKNRCVWEIFRRTVDNWDSEWHSGTKNWKGLRMCSLGSDNVIWSHLDWDCQEAFK